MTSMVAYQLLLDRSSCKDMFKEEDSGVDELGAKFIFLSSSEKDLENSTEKFPTFFLLFFFLVFRLKTYRTLLEMSSHGNLQKFIFMFKNGAIEKENNVLMKAFPGLIKTN
eukprot:GHVP01013932.1.p1 GENE.GHVP01013932.1~~GHVP01013932.1.p1  ORF type:complete len:111 (+),score=22.46 GHVP01013932.1:502-834(+)